MMDWEKTVYKYVAIFNDYIDNVFLAPNQPLWQIIFLRIIPWMIFVTLLGFILQPILSFFAGYIYWLIYEL